MAHSAINIVPNELPLEFVDIRNAMDVPNEALFQSKVMNFNQFTQQILLPSV